MSDQQENTNPAQEPVAPAVTPQPVIPTIGTAVVAAALGIRPIQLRRHLRTLEGGYDDGKHTNYAWTGMEDPEVIRIMTYVRNRQATRQVQVQPAPVAPAPVQDAPVTPNVVIAAPVAPVATRRVR